MLCHVVSRHIQRLNNINLFLIDPVMLSALPALDLLLVEPESDLLLRGLNCIGAVANVAANVLEEIPISIRNECSMLVSKGTRTIAKSPRIVPG